MSERSAGISESWMISTFSGGGECVEVRLKRDVIQIRHSQDPAGPTLEFTPGEWRAFLAGVQAGEFSIAE